MSHAGAGTVAAYVLICGIAQGFSSAVQATASESPVFHIFLSGKARMVVRDSIDGAVRRLGRPRCQQLFTDFADPAGHTLSDTLAALGQTAAEVLADLYFVEGDGSNQCRTEKTTAAFTAPGYRVIYVCGARFAELFARKTTGGEILMIHELLHALGLGENPPISAQITNAVISHCGN